METCDEIYKRINREYNKVYQEVYPLVMKRAKMWAAFAAAAGFAIGDLVGLLGNFDLNNRHFIKVEYTHLNPNHDTIKDRVISNNYGLYQEQFGYINPKTGVIEYLTFKQIREMLRSEPSKDLESELMRYKKDEKF